MRTAGAGRRERFAVIAAALIFALGSFAPMPVHAQTELPEAPAAIERQDVQTPPAAPDGPPASPAGGEETEPLPAPPQDSASDTAPDGTVVPTGDKPVLSPAEAGPPGVAPLTTTPTGTGTPPQPAQSGGPAHDRTFVDSLHGGVSSGFLSTASWLDSFFGNDRYESEINQSQLKIRFDAFREGGTGMDFRRPNFDLRLVLPQLRKKTRLVISGDPNVDVDATTPQPGAPGPVTTKPAERNLSTILQYVPVETFKSNFSIRAGIKLHQGKFAVLAGPRYRYLIPLAPWDLRFTQEVTWSSVDRWQWRTRFDLERPLPSGLFFRSTLEGVWSENVIGYPYALSFIVVQPIDGNRAVQYEWVNSFQTRPTDALIEELLVLRYRQRFWRDWLFLELAPQYRFPRDRSFEATPGIMFRIEMVFGNIGTIF